jgi:hypothetical protein
MMGHRQVEQAALFYEFSLEQHIPPDHLLRSIRRFVCPVPQPHRQHRESSSQFS